jgi:formate hydrogenlyase subunit 3/multisubunit Na+/H+ antiporter MnhD subunit
MIGLPPVAGFVTKWYLGVGALEAGMYWVLAVLVASSLLNAAYFLPILYAPGSLVRDCRRRSPRRRTAT